LRRVTEIAKGATTPVRVAIDLDGVLTEHPAPLAWAANQQYGLELPDSAFVDSAGHNVTDDVRLWVYGAEGPAAQLAALQEALNFLNDLAALCGRENVFIVTARPSTSAQMTLSWLERNGLDICEVVYADDKVEAARKLGITHAIEDSVRHAAAYDRAGITAFFITPEPVEDLNPTIQQVPSLSAIIERVRKAGERVLEADETRPLIVVSDVIDATAHAALEAGGTVVDVDGTDVAALFEAVGEADALVVRSETQVTRELIEHAKHLKVIARAGVGIDNVDVEAATEHGIIVLNAPGANRFSAGEHTIALMLSVARQLADANASMHAGKWERKRFRLFDLRDKTVGIVGLGRVGRVVAERLKAFECHVIAYDPYVSAEIFRETGVERVSYSELLGTSDIITYHVPLTDETRNFLSREAIRQLKPGAVIVNAARGEVIDHEALAEALDEGRIAGAAVDVFPEEPLTWSPLWGKPNVVLTPHLGGSSNEAQAAVGEMISHSVLAALRGESVPNAVNLPAAQIDPLTSRKLGRAASAAGRLLGVLEPDVPDCFAMTAKGNLSDEIYELIFSAALASGLEQWSEARVSPVNARMIARQLGIEQNLSRFNVPTPSGHPDDVEFEFEVTNEDTHHVTIRWSGHDVGLYEVDRFSLGYPLAGDVLITHHHDVPGVVGRVGTILGKHKVNIAGMQLGRHQRGGEALMVLNVDDPIAAEVLTEIKTTLGIANAYVVSLPGADD
jgi:D-3-phosphoglycerate dehydrogenase